MVKTSAGNDPLRLDSWVSARVVASPAARLIRSHVLLLVLAPSKRICSGPPEDLRRSILFLFRRFPLLVRRLDGSTGTELRRCMLMGYSVLVVVDDGSRKSIGSLCENKYVKRCFLIKVLPKEILTGRDYFRWHRSSSQLFICLHVKSEIHVCR